MPRMARLIVPGCPHHVVQRGHNRNAVFVDDGDYEYYLATLAEWKYELGVKDKIRLPAAIKLFFI